MTEFRSSMHNHCTMCDGLSTAEEMAEAAIRAGITDFGMSCHCYAPFDIEYSIDSEAEYIQTLRKLQAKYDGKLRVYCGIEDDYYGTCLNTEYQYKIASLHYIKDDNTGIYHIIDGSQADLRRCCDEVFGGKGLDMVDRYYAIVSEHVAESGAEIVGHFDVITKSNNIDEVFDEKSQDYKDIASAALRKCVDRDVIFEVNTGAIARGYKQDPYPAMFLMEQLRKLGGRVMITTDCHNAAQIDYGVDLAMEYIRRAGFDSICEVISGKIVERKL